MASFANVYHHRKVADTASKPCDVCYKPSTSVLVTPDNKDHFYVCPVHLKEKSFATPVIDQAAIAAKEKREKDAEIERVKQELIAEKKKKEEKKSGEKVKVKDGKSGETDKEGQKDGKKSESEEKSEAAQTPYIDEEPRVFALHKPFYQQRLDKKRNAEKARRERERLQNPNLFPQVPRGPP